MGLRQLYMLDGPEIEFVLEPTWEKAMAEGKGRCGALTFIDAAVGGSGFLDRAAKEFHLVARRAVEHLDHRKCESACYRCLKTYTNQRYHEHLSWPQILPELEELAARAPELLPSKKGDVDDPRPWLEAYDAGVGSPLELKFLRLFEKQGLEVEKQVPVAASDGENPISVADFVLKGARVAIYVDGASFHRGERLRRDRYIRRRLEEGSPGWSVVELSAADLARGKEVVERIQAAAASG
jgi:very-short-patch-repair endonuclease